MKKGILLLAIMAFTVACNTTKKTTTKTDETVEITNVTEEELQGNWTLDFIDSANQKGKKLNEMFPNKLPNLNFNTSDSTVYGSDGCNRISGSYEVKNGNEISIGDKLASTMMACQGVEDHAFNQTLSKATKFTISDGKLLFLSDDVVIMRFVKEQSNIEGTWELVKIQTKDRSTKGIDMRFPLKTPELTFNGEQLSGNTGCNNISSTFKSSGDSIEFGAIAMTKMFCEGVEEHVFTDAINAVKKFRIDGDYLVLSNNDSMDLLTFKRK